MSVITTIEVAAEDFALGGALSVNPGIEIRLERVVPLGSTFIPYFWAEDDSISAIEDAFRAEADINSFEVVDTLDGEALVRVQWQEDVDGLLDVMAETDAVILDGTGTAEGWLFQLRFPDHDNLTAFYRDCASRRIPIDIKSVHNPGIARFDGIGIKITETQRETLMTALDKGYFDVPRRINLTDLATQLGVSDTAVSQRIRRGITTLLNSTLKERVEEAKK